MLSQPVIVLAAALLTSLVAAQTVAPPPLVPNLPLQVDLGAPGTTIVSSAQAPYPAVAERLAAGLAELTAHRPRTTPDTATPAELGSGPVVVVGNLMDNRLLRRLYLHCYDFTDYSWPSPGGHAVRTVRDPLGTGAHVLVLGGSDAAGVAAAVEALLAEVRAQGPRLGYLNLVKTGKWSSEIASFTERYLGQDDKVWTRVGGAGSWDYQMQIAKAGVGYLRTGDERYLPVFKRELRYFFDHYVLNLRTDAPPQTHGFLHTMLVVWDLLRDHPVFTEAERQKFDADFLHVYRSSEGPGRLKSAVTRTVIRDNHGTRTGLDAFYGGRFFLRRFGEQNPAVATEARQWLELAQGYFAPQLGSAKPVEDSWGHQWAASLYDTLLYAVGADQEAYLQSEALQQAADRALLAHLSAAAPRSYMSALAVATGDTGYLSGHTGGDDYGKRCAAMHGSCNEYLRAFCTPEPIRERQDLLGLKIAPLDRLWYDTSDAAGLNPGGLFVSTVPREQGFDKLSMREGWGASDFYLLLDGISGGHHSYEDGNCIIMLREGGTTWSLRTGRSFTESGTVKSGNGVAVALDGSGPGRLHRYARLLYSGENNAYMAVGTAFEQVGDADWQRHIIRKRGQWTLVVDRVLARREGEALAERHWHLRGDVVARPDGLVAGSGGTGARLHLQTAGVLAEGQSGTADRMEVVRAGVRPGEPLEFAALLHCARNQATPGTATQFHALEAACTGEPAAPQGVAHLTDLGIVLLRSTTPGQWLEMPFRLERPLSGEVAVDLLGFSDRGAVRILLDGETAVERHQHRTSAITPQRVSLGRHDLPAGEHRLRLEVVADATPASKCFVGLSGLAIYPGGAPSMGSGEASGKPTYSLTRSAAGWRIEGAGAVEVVHVDGAGAAGFPAWRLGNPEKAPAADSCQAQAIGHERLLPVRPQTPLVPSPWRSLKHGEKPLTAVARGPEGQLAGGDGAGNVVLWAADGRRQAAIKLESAVLSLHFVGAELMVGEDRGALTRLAPDGSVRWQLVIPYVPMPWDYWSEYRCRVREITSADINGDGAEEILISNSDRRIHAFDGSGKPLWQAPVEWGIFTAMTTGRFGGEFGLFGGTSRPSIHGRCLIFGAEGKKPRSLTRPDLMSWSVPSQFRDMRLADLTGDGVAEVITAVDTNCRQLVVYRQDGSVLWDADMSGAAQALAMGVQADGAPVVYCGGASGYVAAFEGLSGKRAWACYLGEPVSLLAWQEDGHLAAVTPGGKVFLLNRAGQLKGQVELSSPVSAVLRPGDHRAGDRLVVGTNEGTLIAR